MQNQEATALPTVDIVLTETFPILSLTLVTEPLRVANRESVEHLWRWRFLSIGGGPMVSSSGMQVDTEPLDDSPSDVVLLLSSYRPESSLVPALLSWLKRRARAGAVMGCVDTGALIFAEAGLLSRVPAAVHFEALRGFREQFAEEMFVDRLFNLSGQRCSSAGGVATFDMTLGLIARFNGQDLAKRVAEILTYRPTGHDGPQQKLLTDTSLARLDRNLARAVDLMLATLDQPLPITEIASRVGVPVWTLGRLFKHYLKASPATYYRGLRLSEARNLLRNSSLRVSDISAACGFDNPESFARAYRRQFGLTATEDRVNERAPGSSGQ
ncbi:GlxA family transcriptional regulator [Aliiroseovarius sp.]|uniref:GlxA family transcriptional regulator n=1 Tax=Aliiroseovarius sp. TaxID=1872442 RepID=UPI003BAAAE5D